MVHRCSSTVTFISALLTFVDSRINISFAKRRPAFYYYSMDRLLLRQVCSLPVCYGSSIEGNNRNKQALVPTANRSQWILSLFPRHCRNGAVKNSRSVSAECLDPTRVLLPLTRLHPMAATSLFVPNYNRSSKRCASCARWFCLQNRLLRDQTDKTAF